jgi:hypothetical protein
MKPFRRSLLALGAGLLALFLGCGSGESCEAVLCEQGTCSVRDERAVCLCGDEPCSTFASELDRMRSEAVPLESMESPREGRTSGGPAAAYFSFAAQAGHKYAFGCGPRSIATCKLRLFDAQGTLLGESEATQDFYILFRAPSPQTYYLAVSSWGEQSGTFEYMFQALGYDDHGDFVAHVTPLQLVDQHVKAEGRHETAGDQDVFSFPAVAGFEYEVTCRATAGAPDLTTSFWNAEGALQSDPGSGRTELRTSYRARSTETLYLVVGIGIASEATGSYSCELVEDEDGDSTQAARTLEPGIDAPGILDVDDVDFLALSVQPGRFYRVSCVAEQGGCGLSQAPLPLPRPGVPILIEAMNAETVSIYVTGPAGTRYVVRAEDLGVDDHGDTATEATPLTAPSAMTGIIQGLSDLDVFSFPGVDGHVYRIGCAGTAGEPGWLLRLVHPSGHDLAFIGGGTGAASELTHEAQVDGTYSVVVASPPAGRVGSYDCGLEDLGPAATGAASAAR